LVEQGCALHLLRHSSNSNGNSNGNSGHSVGWRGGVGRQDTP